MTVYAWIWRILPGGTVGKVLGSTVLLLAVVAVLFFWLFPWAEANWEWLSGITVDEQPDAGREP